MIDVKGWKVTKPDSEPLPFEKLVKNNRKEHTFVSVPSNGVKPQTVIDVKAWRVKTPAQPPDTFETLVKKNRKEALDDISRANLARPLHGFKREYLQHFFRVRHKVEKANGNTFAINSCQFLSYDTNSCQHSCQHSCQLLTCLSGDMPDCEIVCHSATYVERFLEEAARQFPERFNLDLTTKNVEPIL